MHPAIKTATENTAQVLARTRIKDILAPGRDTVLVVVFITGYDRRSTKVPADAVRFQGHSYKVFRERLSWHEARQQCQQMGGDLPCITSREENDFLMKLATQGGFPEWTCCWLNGTDEGQESDWRWASGEPFGLQENLDATGGTSENYLNLRLASGQWEDYSAEGETVGEQWFACEWKP